MPSLESVYAARFVYEGFKNAFTDLGHDFKPFSAGEKLNQVLERFRPDIFMYSLNFFHLKYIDVNVLQRYRQSGLVVFCQVRGWHQLTDEPGSRPLKDNQREVELIRSGLAGDIFWHWFEQDEPLMEGFRENTGKGFETIHQAADKTLYFFEYDEKFASDLAYVGSFLSAKRAFLRQQVLPLRQKYDLRIYGSDWTRLSRLFGLVQKAGQWFNIKPLKRVRKLPLRLDDERKVYSSSKISLNVHEDYVKRFNCEVNERTFKIMACGGFELSDNVQLLRRFFNERELVIATSTDDWFDKITYYLTHETERHAIAEAGRKNVLVNHTYHNRVQQIVDRYRRFRKSGT